MASISQTIPSYNSGISQQPDDKKAPGGVKDCLNVIPDLVHGLVKRPSTKRIGTTPLANVAGGDTTTSWFHYHRDETEGSYIGQVASDGRVRIWSCNDGSEKNVWYATDNSTYNSGTAAHTSITDYLTPSSSANTEDIQALTINDTTFLLNRSKPVATANTTPAKVANFNAYIDILRTENGRQYGCNIWGTDDTKYTLQTVVEIEHHSDNLDEGHGSGPCRGIGTQVYNVDSGDGGDITWVRANGNTPNLDSDDGRQNLVFRVTVLGQQGFSGGGDDANPDNMDYRCSYSRDVTLLHGGRGWENGDQVKVSLTEASQTFDHTIKVTDVASARLPGNIGTGDQPQGIIRPAPTPFDADTAVSIDQILGDLRTQIEAIGGNPIDVTIIGNGLYLSSANEFNIQIQNNDLMRVMTNEVNNVTELPNQCKHGYIVKVANAQMSDEDDYYLKFVGDNNEDGPGSWVECAEPGIVRSINAATMPHILQRQADGDFLVKEYTWADREIGDNNTNPIPSFATGSKTINKVLFFRNRLGFLSGENVILSRAGQLGNFWSDTALTVSPVDPIDIASSSDYPSDLFDGLEINAGLLVFSTNQQFLLSSDDTVFNPDTVKLRVVGAYNYNKVLSPISLGQTQGFIDNSGKYSKLWEITEVRREGEPVFAEASIAVPTLLPKDLTDISVSRENGYVIINKRNTSDLYIYKWQNSGNPQRPRVQLAWFRWQVNQKVKYQFIVNDQLFILDTDNFLQVLNFKQLDTDISIDQDDINYLLHLDNYTTVANGVYNATTKLTTFTDQTDWIDQIDTTNSHPLVLVDSNSNSTRIGRYTECTVINDDDFTVPGNWDYNVEHVVPFTALNASNEQITVTGGHGFSTGDAVRWVEGDSAAGGLTDGTIYYAINASTNNIALASSLSNANAGVAVNITSQGTGNHKIQKLITDLRIGKLYTYQVDLPKIYITKQVSENNWVSDINGSLVIHRVSLNLGKTGLYETTLTRLGKSDYTEIYESTELDEYEASDAPYVEEVIKEIPVYEKNTNVSIRIKSTHPSPATLKSMTWEGNYSPKFYRRQ